MALETLLTIRLKSYAVIDGVPHQAGEVLNLPMRQALDLIGAGLADEIPDPATMVQGPVEQFTLAIDAVLGSFSKPVQFPSPSMLLWCATQTYEGFTGGSQDTSVMLGTGSGRNDILTEDGFGPTHTFSLRTVTGTLPFSADPNPFECWVTINGNGNTAGSGVVTLIFAEL